MDALKQIVLPAVDVVLDVITGYGYVRDEHPFFGWVTLGLAWYPGPLYAILFLYAYYNAHDGFRRKIFIVILTLLLLPFAPIVPMTAAIHRMANNNDQTRYLTEILVLVEASWEASLQAIWQGCIIISDQINSTSATISISGPWNIAENKLELKQQTVAYISLGSSIIVLSTSSLMCFVPSIFNLFKQKSLIMLILFSQAFRTLALTLIVSYFGWFSAPAFFAILISNFYILAKSKIFKKGDSANYLYLFVNTMLNIPMICLFNINKDIRQKARSANQTVVGEHETPKLEETTHNEASVNSEHSDDSRSTHSDRLLTSTASPEGGVPQTGNERPPRDECAINGDETACTPRCRFSNYTSGVQTLLSSPVDHGELDTKDVEKRMIKNTNIILSISVITLTALIYFKIWIPPPELLLTKGGETRMLNYVSKVQ